MVYCAEIFILCNENCPVKVAVFQDVMLCSVVKNLRCSVLKMETASAFKMLVNFYHFTWHRTLKTVILAVCENFRSCRMTLFWFLLLLQ